MQRPGPNQYWTTVDPFSIELLKVTLGPNAVLYGSGAVGGVVEAFTIAPRGYETPPDANARGIYRYGSADSSHQGRAEVSATWAGNVGLSLGVSAKEFGDLEAGSRVGLQPETGFRELDGDIKLVLRPSPTDEIVLLYQRASQHDVPRTHRTVFARPFRGTSVGSEVRHELDQHRDLLYVQYRAEDLTGPVRRAHFSLSWQRSQEERNRVRGDLRRDITWFDVNTIGTFARPESELRFGTIEYGFDYYHDFVDSGRDNYNADGSFASRAIQGAVGDDASYDLLGIFAQGSWDVGEQVKILLGGRFSYAGARADRVQDPTSGEVISISDDWVDFSANLRIQWEPLEALHLYSSVSQGFRAPNLSDLTRFDTARSNEIQTPSTDLEPERFVGLELGLKSIGERWSTSLAGYYTFIIDGLLRTPTGRIVDGQSEVRTRNVGDGYVAGFELYASYRLWRRFEAFGNLSLVYGKQDTFPTSAAITEREFIDRMMPLMALAGIRWSDERQFFWAELSAQFAAGQDRLSTRDQSDTQRIPPGGTPGSSILNLRCGFPLGQHAQVSIAAENLTDETYRIHGSGVTAPGRGVSVTLEGRF